MAGLSDSPEVADQANLVVCLYALGEKKKTEKMARKCGCSSCRLQLTNAQDRVDWAAETGKWHLSNRKRRRACEQ